MHFFYSYVLVMFLLHLYMFWFYELRIYSWIWFSTSNSNSLILSESLHQPWGFIFYVIEWYVSILRIMESYKKLWLWSSLVNQCIIGDASTNDYSFSKSLTMLLNCLYNFMSITVGWTGLFALDQLTVACLLIAYTPNMSKALVQGWHWCLKGLPLRTLEWVVSEAKPRA